MSRKLNVPSGFYTEDFWALAQSSKLGVMHTRYTALYHLQKGASYAEVAQKLCLSFSTVRAWIKRYRNDGLLGLLPRKIPGRPACLSKEQINDFGNKFLEKNANLKGGRLFGEDAKKLLLEEYHCHVHLSTAYRLLHKANLSWISGRSQHPSASEQEQSHFKKTLQI